MNNGVYVRGQNLDCVCFIRTAKCTPDVQGGVQRRQYRSVLRRVQFPRISNIYIGAHRVQRAWLEEKLWFRKTRRPRTSLQLSLDEASWRRFRSQPPRTHDLVYAFLYDLRDGINNAHIRDVVGNK